MQAYRPDRVVRVLTTLVSIAYFVCWLAAIAVLVAAPAAKLLAGGHPNWVWELTVRATVLGSPETVSTSWGAARLVGDDVRGHLLLPIAMLPWWLVAVLWIHAAAILGLILLSVHNLRRIFQRVREGAPFDVQNALRMRWLGLLLLALAVLNGIAELVTSLAIRNRLVSSRLTVSAGLHIDGLMVFVALALVALAEIFRRGTELETEQSLVI